MGKVRKGAWNIHKVTPRLDELQARPVYRCESRRKARQPAHANEGRTVLSSGQGRLSAMKDGVLPTFLDVAETFAKEHYHVLEDIRAIQNAISSPEFSGLFYGAVGARVSPVR